MSAKATTTIRCNDWELQLFIGEISITQRDCEGSGFITLTFEQVPDFTRALERLAASGGSALEPEAQNKPIKRP